MSDATAPAPAKSGKKTLLIIIATAVACLALGGGGAWFFLGHKAGDTEADHEEVHEPKAKSKKKSRSEPKLPGQFVALDPPFVVNFGPGSSVRFLQVTVQLMTREPLMVEFLKSNAPIIRNDLLLLFGNKTVEEVSTNEGKEALRTASLEAIRKIIEDEGEDPEALEAVYFTSFVMQ